MQNVPAIILKGIIPLHSEHCALEVLMKQCASVPATEIALFEFSTGRMA